MSGEAVVGEHPRRTGRREPDDPLDRLHRLEAADHPTERAEHARLAAVGHGPGGRRLGKQKGRGRSPRPLKWVRLLG